MTCISVSSIPFNLCYFLSRFWINFVVIFLLLSNVIAVHMEVLANSFCNKMGYKNTHKYKNVILHQDSEMLKANKRFFTCVSLKSPTERVIHRIWVSFHISSKLSDLIHALTKHTFLSHDLTNINT